MQDQHHHKENYPDHFFENYHQATSCKEEDEDIVFAKYGLKLAAHH